MKRKVIKQGNGTLTITLPKEWTKEMGLSGDNEVELSINQNNLLVSTIGVKKDKSMSINVDHFERLSFAKFLIACYELGFDTMTLTFSKDSVNSWSHGKENVTDVINFFITRLVGFEVLSQTEKSITIGNIAEKHMKFESILSRIFFLIEEYLNHLHSSLSNKNFKLLNDGETRHDNITKLIALATRTVYESSSFSKVEVMGLSTLLNELDKITDFIRHIYHYMQNYKGEISKSTIDIVKKTVDFVEMFRSFHNKFSYKIINDLDYLRGDIRKGYVSGIKRYPFESIITSNCYGLVEILNGAVKPRIAMELDKNNLI